MQGLLTNVLALSKDNGMAYVLEWVSGWQTVCLCNPVLQISRDWLESLSPISHQGTVLPWIFCCFGLNVVGFLRDIPF